jgi:hypothetical protein
MKKAAAIILALLILAAFTGCSTLSVRIPRGMYISTGDYVPEIETLGVLQEKMTVFAPLFMVNVNRVHEQLYEQLIDKASRTLGADGVTNITFSWKPSPLMYVSLFVVSGVFDFYIEGIAIREK